MVGLVSALVGEIAYEVVRFVIMLALLVLAVFVGGKVSNTRKGPTFSKLVVPYIPNEPPRWPTLVNTIKHLVEIWVENAKPGERYGEWVERIGWEKFFEISGLEFTDKHIDDFLCKDLPHDL